MHEQYFPLVVLPSGDRIAGVERWRRLLREGRGNELRAALAELRGRAGGDAAAGDGA